MQNQDKIQAYVELLSVANKHPEAYTCNYYIRGLKRELKAKRKQELEQELAKLNGE